MAEVHLQAPEDAGLAGMIAGLIEANLAADPARERLLTHRRGTVEIVVPDAGVVVGLKLLPGVVTVTGERLPGADVRVVADADTVLGLSTVPLRAGFPDPLSPAGRALAGQVLRGRLRIRCRPTSLPVLATLNRLLSVA